MPAAEPIPLDVLYEDEDLMAVNKPPGMVVHPTYRNVSGTVLNGVLWRFRDRSDIRPGLVSRLDKDTSGVLLVALSPGAHARLQRDAHAGRVTKEYLAVIQGTPSSAEGTISLPLRRDPVDRRRVIVDHTGTACETRYRVVEIFANSALVQCELVTGRTHQIRVHLAASGWPIIGDPTYGVADPRISRQALHASRVAFLHPATRIPMSIVAPVPADMQVLSSYPLQLGHRHQSAAPSQPTSK